jgi:large subunit ribosomal protein L9
MNIILLQDIDKVGEQYQIVKVRDGYGNNFLIPKGMAVVANDSNRRKYAGIVRALEKRESARLGEYQSLAAKVNGKTVKVIAKAGSSGKLFGSVDATQIASAISAQLGVEVDRKKVVCEPLKELGTHIASVIFHKEVHASVNVEIVSEEEMPTSDPEGAPMLTTVDMEI